MSSKTTKNGCLIVIAGFLISCLFLKLRIKQLDKENFKLAIPRNIEVEDTIAILVVMRYSNSSE
jgi:hypothetical protein